MELGKDIFFCPFKIVDVLEPLIIADCYSSGVGENIGDDNFSPFGQDFVGLDCGWAVGEFEDDVCFYVACVFVGDNVLKSCRYENVCV